VPERLQRRLGLQIIPGVFFTSAGIAALFVALAVPFDDVVAESFGLLTSWVAGNLGWFYILSVSGLFIFMAVALFRALRADYRGYSMNERALGRAFPEDDGEDKRALGAAMDLLAEDGEPDLASIYNAGGGGPALC
jgi:hypothetical protein